MKRLLALVAIFLILAGCGTTSPTADQVPVGSSADDIPSASESVSPEDSNPPAEIDTPAPSESESATKSAPIAETELFKQIYVPFACREQADGYSSVVEFLDGAGYEYTADAPGEGSACQITVLDDESSDDYVYFAFIERETEYEIMIVSYYQAASKSEVSLSNYSTDGSYAYDQFQTHVIGNSTVRVESVDDQREFLFGA